MNDISLLKSKIDIVKKGLKGVANLRVQADDPRHAIIQGILSRGDKNIADILLKANNNKGNWTRTLKELNLSETDIYRERAADEIFPYDFIEDTVNKSFLRKEYELGISGKNSRICPMTPESCKRCGVC